MMSSPNHLLYLKIPLKKILSVTNNFDDKNIIGRGEFEKRCTGQLFCSGELIKIIARRWLNKERNDREQVFWMNIFMLSSLKHKNLVSLIGFCDENDEKIIIYKDERRGSLSNHLSNTMALTWVRRLRICVGIAHALSYIHYDESRDFSVIHRKLCSATILLNYDWEPKLSNFDFSMKTEASQSSNFEHTTSHEDYA
ncbi:kinase-like domain, phloem protein 2-like protein [Tanacetum coccineum]|uniref:Kinase-like domain, phloem protein 2-like protein n=1 Tax=Tanacetum coccineum TaxID=301880 RepID=A0ABQ5HYP7_9ASTR